VQLKPYEPYVPKVSKLAFVVRIEHLILGHLHKLRFNVLNITCNVKSYLWLGNI
jgi:hypothetical protein